MLFALAIQLLGWGHLSPPGQQLANQLGITEAGFPAAIESIRARNAARLRQGEIDHLIFHMLQSKEFTAEDPIDPAAAAAAAEAVTPSIRRRIADFSRALAKPAGSRQIYFATLVPPKNADSFLEEQLARVLKWIREKESGCRRAAAPQACIADLYVNRGHSSDTSPQSMEPVRAAFEWLRRTQTFRPKRILIVGPGTDFAPRTALRDAPETIYQPRLTRELAGGARVDCVDLNPRVVLSAAGECDAAQLLDITTERLPVTYDVIIATNVLLYFDEKELLLAMHNIRAMLAHDGVFIHNEARFAVQLFGRAAGLPHRHFGSVTLDPTRRPPLVDRFVIHSPAAPKL